MARIYLRPCKASPQDAVPPVAALQPRATPAAFVSGRALGEAISTRFWREVPWKVKQPETQQPRPFHRGCSHSPQSHS